MKYLLAVLSINLFLVSCSDNAGTTADANSKKDSSQSYIEKNLSGYAKVKLTTDLSKLTEKEKQ